MAAETPTTGSSDLLAHAARLSRDSASGSGLRSDAVALLESALVTVRRSRLGLRARDEPADEGGLRSIESLLDGAAVPDAHRLGEWYQRMLAAGEPRTPSARRRRFGAFYTPPGLIRHVLDRCGVGAPSPRTVLDPACGCGAFLTEAVRAAVRCGTDPERALSAVHGVDIDADAARLCRLGLWLEHGDPEGHPGDLADRVHAGDSLAGLLPDDSPEQSAPWRWAARFGCLTDTGGFDVVLGNPPFLSQLGSSTARSRDQARALRARFGDAVRAYTDPAALFLLLAARLVREGGRIGMVLPLSVLAARDARQVRSHLTSSARLRSMWVDTEGAFDAGVRTCAVVLETGSSRSDVTLTRGNAFEVTGQHTISGDDPNWSALAAEAVGIPRVEISSAARLGELAEITAGFRDEYYAVAGALEEAAGCGAHPVLKVVTSGLVDPFGDSWGHRACRIAKREWVRPVVRRETRDPVLTRLIRSQSRPKLLVATQTRVLEVFADAKGECLGATPVIAVIPEDDGCVWRLGAAISSPVMTAWIARLTFGTARSMHALKPSARDLRAAPTPGDARAWADGAALFRELSNATELPRAGALSEFGALMCVAYGLSSDSASTLTSWWLGRIMHGRAAGRRSTHRASPQAAGSIE